MIGKVSCGLGVKILAGSLMLVACGCAMRPEPERICEANFSFVYRGVEHRGVPHGWTSTAERSCDAEGGREYVTTRAVEPDTGFELVLVETRYRDLPVYEWEVSFENRGKSDSGRLTRISSVDWNVPLAGEGCQIWHGTCETDNKHADKNYAFEKVAITNGMEVAWQAREGYPSYFAFPYFRLSDRTDGYTVALGYQGQWAGAMTCRSGKVNLRAGQQTVDFYLKPGERAISPKITVMKFRDADDAVNGWRRFMRRYVLPRAKDGKGPIRPILAGGHHEGGCLFVQTTEKGQIDAIRRLADAGIYPDTWWIDAGWYTRTSKCSEALLKDPLVWYRTAGDWTADPERLPNGFKPIANELAKHGGNLTLWFEPERLYMTSPFMEMARPYLIPGEFGGSRRYDLSRPETLVFLGKYIGDQFDYHDVGIYRQDSNGWGPLGFWKSREEEIGDRRHGFVENLAVRGQFELWNEWHRRRPHMLFDTCASGGRRNDLSTLRFPSLPLHYSDTSYGDPVAKQRHYHFMNEWLFYHKNNSGHFNRGGVFNRRIAVSQLAQFYHFQDTHLLNGDRNVELEYLDFWRRLTPLTIDGDYYLLTPEAFAEDKWWVTEFFDPAKGEGFLQVVRNPKSQEDVCRVTIRGLKQGVKVQCEDLYAHRMFDVVAGEPVELSLKPDDGTFIVFRVR